MAQSDVRRLLLKKTGWDRKALSARVKRLRDRTPMSTETAQAVLAHQNGIRIDPHLEPEAVALVQSVLPRVADAGGEKTSRIRSADRGPARSSAPRPIVFANSFDYADPLLPHGRVQEAREMAGVYPMLYVLENSVREFVKRVMTEKHGEDWWDTQLTSGRAKTAKANADGRRQGERNRRWHQRRSADPIDYTQLDELKDLIIAKREVFVEVLGEQDLNHLQHNILSEVEPSRNVLCHMNPLDQHSVASIRTRLNSWRRILKAWVESDSIAKGPE